MGRDGVRKGGVKEIDRREGWIIKSWRGYSIKLHLIYGSETKNAGQNVSHMQNEFCPCVNIDASRLFNSRGSTNSDFKVMQQQ